MPTCAIANTRGGDTKAGDATTDYSGRNRSQAFRKKSPEFRDLEESNREGEDAITWANKHYLQGNQISLSQPPRRGENTTATSEEDSENLPSRRISQHVQTC